MHARLKDALHTIKRLQEVVAANRETPPEVLAALRRKLGHDDPLVFALLYLPHHLTLDDGTVSLSQIHADWLDDAARWGAPAKSPTDTPRDIYIAPRGTGKSTWFFLVFVAWAAATGRVRFAAAFADSATQAEGHLQTFRTELERNERLREDYPQLCEPAKRGSGATVADNRGMLHCANGFAFAARGIDSGTLGLKVGDSRPDLLIADDIEPGEAQYSVYQMEKRLSTLTDVILPMGAENARTVLVGTVTMSGSIIHQAVQHAVEPAPWVKDEHFEVHHALPFDGTGASIWPERWPTKWLHQQEGSKSFAKNFLNSPLTADGEYWTPDDFIIRQLPTASRRILAVDPAVTTAKTSDETAIAVVSYSAYHRAACVDHIEAVRMKGEPLRTRLLAIVERYPDIAELVWERNQGGEALPESVLHDFPVPVRTVHQTERKEFRAERALSYYRRRAIWHAQRFPKLEAQMTEFPRGLHDDMVDVVSLALDQFSAPRQSTLSQAVR